MTKTTFQKKEKKTFLNSWNTPKPNIVFWSVKIDIIASYYSCRKVLFPYMFVLSIYQIKYMCFYICTIALKFTKVLLEIWSNSNLSMFSNSNLSMFLFSGMHDVVIQLKDEKKEVRFVVELEFRAEFEMAKACQDYSKLVNQLPESYVGKFEHLNALVRVICNAGKRAMNEKKIHMGPWRKRKFMQMKWSGSYRRWLSADSPITPLRSRELHSSSFLRCSTAKVAWILAGSWYNATGILDTVE